MSKCILCRKCIRACDEIAGQKLYSMAYRGFGSKVVVDCDVPLDKEVCKDCGICIEYCPTSALLWPAGSEPKGALHRSKALEEPPPEKDERRRLLDLLKEKQRDSGYISEEAIAAIAASLGISVSEVYGVASFYAFLYRKPQGKHIIKVCKSLPCHIKEAPMIMGSVKRKIGIGPGETTTDGMFTFQWTNCIGACDQAPAMLIDNTVYGNLTPQKISEILDSYN